MNRRILVLVPLLVCCFFYSCKNNTSLTPAQQTAIHYLYMPALLCDTLPRQLWHPALDFRGYDVGKQQLYFIAKNELDRAQMLQLLTLDTSKVEYAPCSTGICEFGGMRGVIDGYYAFRIPCSNLKVDTSHVFTYRYNDTTLNVTFSELIQEQDKEMFYHTPKGIDLTKYFGRPVYAGNIGANISKADKDPVIKKLADKITAGLQSNEAKAQALLQYVTTNISYSYEDLWYETEVAKRAHEVLLSGDGDCSAKTTLYASLLEQCAIPYCLLYYKNHVNVGVRGNFANENGYTQKVNDQQYAVA
ncbi:MAG: transglutaminase family protein [Chitinophagaceae bacterium]|nr:transglutaminase family protein [Chitinophagaceae bacterium]